MFKINLFANRDLSFAAIAILIGGLWLCGLFFSSMGIFQSFTKEKVDPKPFISKIHQIPVPPGATQVNILEGAEWSTFTFQGSEFLMYNDLNSPRIAILRLSD